jgi:hypothetical protein
MDARRLVVLVAAVVALAVPAQASASQDLTPLTPDRGGQGIGGIAVAIDGSEAVVGLFNAAYVFNLQNGRWVQTATLSVSSQHADPNGRFGTSVAINGDRIVVGAPGEGDGLLEPGAAYLYSATGAANRTEIARLTAPAPPLSFPDAQFGTAVALDSRSIVVGAPGDFGGGRVYAFRRDLSRGPVRYGEEALQSGGVNTAGVGASLADSNGYVIAGAPDDDRGEGAALVFAVGGIPFEGGVQPEQGKLRVNEAGPGAHVGRSVAISGGNAVVGAPNINGGRGAAYRFGAVTNLNSGKVRTESAKFVSTDPKAGAQFGFGVAVGGSNIFVGDPQILGGGGVRKFSTGDIGVRTAHATFDNLAGGSAQFLGNRVATDAAGGTILTTKLGVVTQGVWKAGPAFVFTGAGTGLPKITHFKLSPHTVQRGAKARFKFTLRGTTKVTIKVERRVGKRFRVAKRLKATSKAGANKLTLKTGGLKVGNYRATLSSTNITGTSSSKTTFKVR